MSRAKGRAGVAHSHFTSLLHAFLIRQTGSGNHNSLASSGWPKRLPANERSPALETYSFSCGFLLTPPNSTQLLIEAGVRVQRPRAVAIFRSSPYAAPVFF